VAATGKARAEPGPAFGQPPRGRTLEDFGKIRKILSPFYCPLAAMSLLSPPRPDLDQRGGVAMKRKGLWAIGIGVFVSVGSLAVEQGYAEENEAKCTLATLNGQYLFAGSGTLFPPAFGVTAQSTAASDGYHVFNGDGTGMDFVTFSVNGIDLHVPSPVPITYTLNPDCAGTYSVQNGPNFDIFVAVDGSALSTINTDPGVSFSEGPNQRVGFGR